MARITVEDCLEQIDNRFDLVLVAARRAHMLRNGATGLLPWDNDKPAVLALREIAAGEVTPDILDQPLQAPEEEMEPEALAALHKEAAEMVVEDLSAADEEEDFDDDSFDDDFEGEGDEAGETPVTAEAAAQGDAEETPEPAPEETPESTDAPAEEKGA